MHIGAHKSQKRSAHVTCSYARVRARIKLKIGMSSTINVRKPSLKFEIDPFSGSREIDVLLHGRWVGVGGGQAADKQWTGGGWASGGQYSTVMQINQSEASMQYSSGAKPSYSISWPRVNLSLSPQVT